MIQKKRTLCLSNKGAIISENVKKKYLCCKNSMCFLSAIFCVYSFSSEKGLYEIGTNIEYFFHFHTDINILVMQSFLTSISSGIFASTLVAGVFYKQEFERNKRDSFIKNSEMQF